MDSKLKSTTRNPQEDKILTKTMINNYAKNDLLPPPVKKKYSREHVLILIFIYYYKGILSISDIQALLKPITERFFTSEGEFNLSDIYREVFSLEEKQVDVVKEDIMQKFQVSTETFQNAPESDQDFLQLFSFICMLSFDVYVKKLLIEKMVDSFGEAAGKNESSKEAKSKENKNNKAGKGKREDKADREDREDRADGEQTENGSKAEMD